MNIQDYFSETGPIAKAKDGYEHRPQQAEMAAAVEKDLKKGGVLMVEAGTGVGKSFAYLAPSLLHAQGDTKQRVVISTRTINLQEQLMRSDLPFLCDVLPGKFRVELAQGGGNYLCLRRLHLAETAQMGLFESKKDVRDFKYVRKWAEKTRAGLRSEMTRRVSNGAWGAANRESITCRRNCDHAKECFFRRARRRLESAELIVVNHALLLSDLRLKQNEARVLPDFKSLVMDEAQHLEDIASDHLGLGLNRPMIAYLLNLLSFSAAEFKRGKEWQRPGDEAARVMDGLFDSLRERFRSGERERDEKLLEGVDNSISEPLRDIAGLLDRYAKDATNEEEMEVFSKLSGEFAGRAIDAEIIITRKLPDYIYWGAISGEGKRETLSIMATPAEVGEKLKEVLFTPIKAVTLTSATLTVGGTYNYLKSRLGIAQAGELLLGSPFDFERQVTLRLRPDLPDPRRQESAFLERAAQVIEGLLEKSEGGAFLLFTSYDSMRRVYDKLADKLGDDVYVQGDDLERTEMLERFRKTAGVLFGTTSFWEGVDVPGKALSLVVIVKLPFAPPVSPVPKERMRRIDAKGGNSFMDYSLPQAVIRLRQGFGRLIRTREDYGTVAILDPRILTKRYGQVFRDSLPKCDVIIDGQD